MGPERAYRGRAKRSRGFTLTELLVAMAILAVALIAVSAMLLFASSNVDYSGGTAQASALAQRRLEELRNSPFKGAGTTLVGLADATTTNPPTTPASTLPQTITVNNTPFTVQSWVRHVGGTAAPRREIAVTVMVFWTESVGGAKQLRLDALVAE